jgi:hypothetical protein
MQQQIRELVNQHVVIYQNYFADPRFNTNDFADDAHLNETGAAKFSKIVNQEIVEKIL